MVVDRNCLEVNSSSTMPMTSKGSNHKKVIVLLDADKNYLSLFKLASSKEDLEILNCQNLSEFIVAVLENEQQLRAVIVNSSFIAEMLKRSLLYRFYRIPFVVTGHDPYTKNFIEALPVETVVFIHKKNSVNKILDRVSHFLFHKKNYFMAH